MPTFFDILDIDGDGYLNVPEIEALFQNEVSNTYVFTLYWHCDSRIEIYYHQNVLVKETQPVDEAGSTYLTTWVEFHLSNKYCGQDSAFQVLFQ